jgi:hypothetical protein
MSFQEDALAVAQRGGAGGVGAEEVAGDGVAAGGGPGEDDAGVAEAVDDQPAHGAVGGGDGQAVGVGPRGGAVQLDGQHRVAAAVGPRLGVAVEQDGAGHRRQGGGEVDGVDARAGDGEPGDVAGVGRGVGAQDRLAERTEAAVGGVGDREGGGGGSPLEHLQG